MKLFAGTSGYSYKEWVGGFYPQGTGADDMLPYYATQLPAVEINNTFYRLPRRAVVETWAQQVPDDFRFAVKASRRITHIKRIRNARDETEYMLDVLRTLGARLGPVLFQLPPNFKCDVDRLEDFLDDLPRGVRAAFEFRHPTWFEDATYGLLDKYGAALCVADDTDMPAEIKPTAEFGYLRLRRSDYSDEELRGWRERIDEQPWRHAYVFFKHEDASRGPGRAARFLELTAT